MPPQTKVIGDIVVEGGGLVNGILEPLVLGRAAEAGVGNVIIQNMAVAEEAIMVCGGDLEEDLEEQALEIGTEISEMDVVGTEEDPERERYFSIEPGRHHARGRECRHYTQGEVTGIGRRGVDLVWTGDLALIVRGWRERGKERGSERENA